MASPIPQVIPVRFEVENLEEIRRLTIREDEALLIRAKERLGPEAIETMIAQIKAALPDVRGLIVDGRIDVSVVGPEHPDHPEHDNEGGAAA